LQGIEVADHFTIATTQAKVFIHSGNISGRSQHGGAVPLRMKRGTAACAAVANGVEAPQHGILKKGMVDVPALIFLFEDLLGLPGRNPARAFGLVFNDKTGEGLPYNQAHVHRQAGVLAGGAAGAVNHSNVVRVFQDDLARFLVRDHPFQITQVDILIYRNQLGGGCQRKDLTMIGIFKLDLVGQAHWLWKPSNSQPRQPEVLAV
jgi:hypothetical protein